MVWDKVKITDFAETRIRIKIRIRLVFPKAISEFLASQQKQSEQKKRLSVARA